MQKCKLVQDAMPSLIGIILLETLQMMVEGAVGLTFEYNGKMVPVSKRGKVSGRCAFSGIS